MFPKFILEFYSILAGQFKRKSYVMEAAAASNFSEAQAYVVLVTFGRREESPLVTHQIFIQPVNG